MSYRIRFTRQAVDDIGTSAKTTTTDRPRKNTDDSTATPDRPEWPSVFFKLLP